MAVLTYYYQVRVSRNYHGVGVGRDRAGRTVGHSDMYVGAALEAPLVGNNLAVAVGTLLHTKTVGLYKKMFAL